MASESLPVLVVGAGPTGLAAALALTQSGIPLHLIDRLPEPTSQSRAAVIHARTIELFERLGIAEDFLARGVKIHGAAIYGPEGKLLSRPNMDHLPTAYAYMLGLEQSVTEALLAERLSALGVTAERKVELLGFEQTESSVRVRLRNGDGRETEAEYSYLVGCDGARSAARAGLGLHLEGETLDATWITADVKIRWDRSSDEAIAYLSPQGFAFIAPMNDDRWRVIVNVPKMTPEQAEKLTLEEIQAMVLERFGLDAPLYDPVWISPFSINTRIAPTMRNGRVFLAGDASHVHSPIGGQGMNTGIQDALNLAWKLALVHAGRAVPELLDSYNPERHGNAKRLLQMVGPATKVVNLRHPVTVEIRNLFIRMVAQLGMASAMARNFSMLEVAYPGSPIVEDHDTHWFETAPRAGHRAPDAAGMVIPGAQPQRLFELWKGDSRHILMLFAGSQLSAERLAEWSTFAESGKRADILRPMLITAAETSYAPNAVLDTEGHAHEAYQALHGALYLIRPDGYVAFRSSLDGKEALAAYVARWFPASMA